MGVRSEKSAGVVMKASLGRFFFEGLGLQFYFSFKLLSVHPNFVERSERVTLPKTRPRPLHAI